jgi:hypothetical protein
MTISTGRTSTGATMGPAKVIQRHAACRWQVAGEVMKIMTQGFKKVLVWWHTMPRIGVLSDLTWNLKVNEEKRMRDGSHIQFNRVPTLLPVMQLTRDSIILPWTTFSTFQSACPPICLYHSCRISQCTIIPLHMHYIHFASCFQLARRQSHQAIQHRLQLGTTLCSL